VNEFQSRRIAERASRTQSAEILVPGGKIAARLPHYEHRPEQLGMAEQWPRRLATERHLVVEAGTGVGKSFAYLIPAIFRDGCKAGRKKPSRPRTRRTRRGKRRRIVIATHTISLQEQLITKDCCSTGGDSRVHGCAGQGAGHHLSPGG
jgi:ATP-dependent DNA helicase DinG